MKNYKPLSLVIVINSPFPDYSGGRERWLGEFAQRLSATDKLTIYCRAAAPWNRRRTGHTSFQPSARCRLLRFPRLIPYTERVSYTYRLFILDYILFGLFACFALRVSGRTNTLIIYMNPGLEALPLMVRRPRRPAFVFVRGDWAAETCWGGSANRLKRLKRLERLTYSRSTKVLLNGWDTERRLRQERLLSDQEIHVVPNGVDFDRFWREPRPWIPSTGALVVAVLGTLRPIKGTSTVVDALVLLARSGRNVQFRFAGKGDPYAYAARLEGVVPKNRYQFLGSVANVPDFLASAHVSICYSGGNGVSHALLESLAAGCAVVARDSDTYRQVLRHGESALLVDSARSMARALSDLMDSPRLLESLAYRGQTLAREYDWTRIVGETLEIAHSSLRKKQRECGSTRRR